MSETANPEVQRTIELSSANGRPASAYRFGGGLPKPCVHPLVTDGGVVLTAYEPADHVWHRGLWFAIKYINGTNFWEENSPFGVQVSRSPPSLEIGAGVSRIRHELRWTSEATGPVIDESRELTFRSSDNGSARVIDWSSKLTALSDLTLDRTPYTTWGGYSGITIRGSNALRDMEYLLPNGTATPTITGERREWIILRAKVADGRLVSVAMIDHPSNPRSPSPWYCRSDENYNFANAAFLFHEPMLMDKDQTLSFRYRIAYRDGWWNETEIATLVDLSRPAS